MFFFELKLAWRYFRARRRSLARFTSWVAIVGIAAGVASLIIAQGLGRGFADGMRDKILVNTAHISVFARDGGEIPRWREIAARLEKSEKITAVRPVNYQSAVLIGKTSEGYAILRTAPETGEPQIISDLGSRNEGKTPEIALGAELAVRTGLAAGDDAELVIIEEGRTPRTCGVKIKETFRTGLYEYDSVWINVSPENLLALTDKKDFAPTTLNLSVEDIYATDETARRVRRELGENFKVLDWQEANRPLFAALSLERRMALAIISLIVFIASLNITATLALLVNERKLDIAVLRTCGARTRNLAAIFLIEGALLGLIGIFFGVIVGMSGCRLGNYFRVISLPTEVYSLDFIRLDPGWENILSIAAAAFFLALTATFYPAFKASRIKPLENLRRR
ncbi:MAG: ABC transporter permease [Pyrinomonadaceae bacterium]